MFYNELIQRMISNDTSIKPDHVYFFKDFAHAHYVYVIGSHRDSYNIVECVHCYREVSIESWGYSGNWIPKQLGLGTNSNSFLEKISSEVGEVSVDLQVCSSVQPAYPSFFLSGDAQRHIGFYRNREANLALKKIESLIEARKNTFEKALEAGILLDFSNSPVDDRKLESLYHLVEGFSVRVRESIVKLNKNLELF